MVIKRFNEFPGNSGTLTSDDIFLFMDNPASSGVTRKITLSEISEAIGGGGGGSSTDETTSSSNISSNTLVLDLDISRIFLVNLNDDINTITISNVPTTANISTGITIIFTGDDTTRSVTWPISIKWPSNIVPTLTSTNGKQSIISLITTDNGTSWLGFVGGLNY